MPGYRALSSNVTGAAADHAREAESLRREGDPHMAVQLLESAIEATRALNAELPGWLCGRLAALYRTLGRYDDEVLLLEQYRESQRTEEARTRFDARLSKARTIAERKRRSDSGALSSVRKVMGTPRRRGATAVMRSTSDVAPPAPLLPAELVVRLAAALDRPDATESAELDDVLAQIGATAKATAVPVEALVVVLREVSARASSLTDTQRAERYSESLLRLLAVYFDEVAR
ncbi:MAG: hypothetical protein JWN53_1528 [Gemmatimonadetes bacterium]|nr:hypothetical protein [Gemmatimonadota bacterium]